MMVCGYAATAGALNGEGVGGVQMAPDTECSEPYNW